MGLLNAEIWNFEYWHRSEPISVVMRTRVCIFVFGLVVMELTDISTIYDTFHGLSNFIRCWKTAFRNSCTFQAGVWNCVDNQFCDAQMGMLQILYMS